MVPMINHLTRNRHHTTSTKLNREQPIYGGSFLRDPASGDLRSALSRSFLMLPPFALMVPSYLLRGYFAVDFGNQLRGIAVEEADGMLSELAVRGHLEVSLEHGRLHYALWERDAPHKRCCSLTSMLVT